MKKQSNVQNSQAESQANLKPSQPADTKLGARDTKDQVQTQGKMQQPSMEKEFGGPKGLEPTRYGDWEAKGRCYDF